MCKPFSVNVSRFDPYKTFRFLVYFGTSTTPVAGVSKISALKRSADVIEYKEGGNAIIRKGLGRTQVRADHARARRHPRRRFEDWANAGAGARQGSADVVAEEPAQGASHRAAQRAGPARAPLHRPPLLGVGVPGACPTSTPARTPSRSSTSSSRTRAGSTISRSRSRRSSSDAGTARADPHCPGAVQLDRGDRTRRAAAAGTRCRAGDGRRARGATGSSSRRETTLDASALPIGDVDALLAELRAAALGDRLIAEGRCPACDCAVDIDFSLAAFREHRAPERPRGATPADRPGWWRLRRTRSNSGPDRRDVLAAQDADDPTASIAAACIRSVGAVGDTAVPRPALAASERAMAGSRRRCATMSRDLSGLRSRRRARCRRS